ncbi:MAG: hypothetical protein J7480_07055, partial [Microbacteriaceae bacterium]|nr:hypothetical protein [Microbacteriaceae bacterium]
MTIASPIRRTAGLVTAAVAAAALLAGCATTAPAAETTDPAAEAAPASYGEISVQYSWIKNEEFAGEF